MPNKIKKTYIIADISSNHMGNMAIAQAMIDVAANIGIDCVKFQSWKAGSLRKDFPDYNATYNRHKKTELSEDDHLLLIEHCKKNSIDFLTTCFDLNRIDFLASLGIDTIKVASPDCGSIRLLESLMKHFKKLIISTGMTQDTDVQKAIEVTRGHDVVFLHCVSLYPTPPEKVNMKRLDWLKSMGVRVGYSDHTMGVDAGKLAISRGAEILEKHYTLSRDLPGKDQAMSMMPEELAELCRFAKVVERMDGVSQPELSEDEKKLRAIYVGKWGNNR